MFTTGSWSKLQLSGNLHYGCIFFEDTSQSFLGQLFPRFVAALKDQRLIGRKERVVDGH